ncbi:Transmembrane protein 94-like 7, partial [Homarus americanus]
LFVVFRRTADHSSQLRPNFPFKFFLSPYHVINNQEMACSADGLPTSEALSLLHEDISIALDEYQKTEAEKNKGFGPKSVLYEAFHHKSSLSVFHWTSVIALIVEGIVLLVAFAACNDPRYQHLPAESFFIFLAVILNVYLVWWDTQLRHKEVPRFTHNVLKDLKEYHGNVLWSAENYPHLHSPPASPSSGLVAMDSCSGGGGELHMGDIYSPNLEGIGEGFSSPKAQTPLRATPYILLETPYISNLRILLAEALNRPVTVFNKQRYYLFSWAMETVILPIVVGLILIINALRVYYGSWVGDWTEVLLMGPVCGSSSHPSGSPFSVAHAQLAWYGTDPHLSDPMLDPFEDAELEALQLSEMSVRWIELRKHFILTMAGKEPSPIRTANVLHVLASVTVRTSAALTRREFCRGRTLQQRKCFSSRTELIIILLPVLHLCMEKMPFSKKSKLRKIILSNPTKESESVLMSPTHDHQTAFGLQFDDPMWRRYLLSLKPLGLNILLNTCNPATQNHYTQFCAHITCEAMYNEDLVPVSQRS